MDDVPPDPQLAEAIHNEIIRESERVLGFLIHDIAIENYQLSEDGSNGTAWLIYYDRETGYVIPTEPGLVIYEMVDGRWEVTLPSSRQWNSELSALPEALLAPKDLPHWEELYQQSVKTTDLGPYSGYLLPWRPNEVIQLSRSITHYTPPNPSGSMHYSFDFFHPYVNGSVPMFELIASKSGRVKYAKWDQPNGTIDSPGNYLVIEDISTDPTTYMLYLHLAQDSIPAELRVPGTPVTQGQYIGLADDTGASTANHLHFQVHTNSYSYWGSSIDITFDDVDINGGRPRTYLESVNYPQYGSQYHSGNLFTSQNYYLGDRTPPVANISSPAAGSMIDSNFVTIAGNASDNLTGLRSVEILANYSGSWHTISPAFTTNSFQFNWDMCADNVPVGPVAIYLLAQDVAGNIDYDYPGFRYFTKQASCQPAAEVCSPDSDEVAIFEEPGYQGDCTVLGSGDYPSSTSFAPLLDNQISSIKIGDHADATIYTSSSYGGRSETLTRSDPNLLDNRVGSNTISSMRVDEITTPSIPIHNYPSGGVSLTDTESIDLIVNPLSGDQEFQFELVTPSSTETSSWSDLIVWGVGSLEPGQYQWRVRARNDVGTSSWSNYSTFQVTDEDVQTSSETAPYNQSFEDGHLDGWLNSGYWALISDTNNSFSGSWFWQYTRDRTSYSNSARNSGDLTSPEVTIPITTTEMMLEFWYKYDTENSLQHWDQRWLQLSINGAPFNNILQLTDDPEVFWTRVSIPLDLDTTITNTVQARFHFNTIDAIDNAHAGWYIDEFSVIPDDYNSCSFTPDTNDRISTARQIEFNTSISDEICPPGDYDYYWFNGTENDQIVIDLDTPISSGLDGMVFLYDENFTLVTFNDDEIPYDLVDPLLTFTLPDTGVYYFRVQPWDKHQGTGAYSIRLKRDNQAPQITGYHPTNNSIVTPMENRLSLDIIETSGLDTIAYFWHPPDWQVGIWELISVVDGSNNGDFSVNFTPPPMGNLDRIDFYAIVTDKFGNWTATGEWKTYYLNVNNQFFIPVIIR